MAYWRSITRSAIWAVVKIAWMHIFKLSLTIFIELRETFFSRMILRSLSASAIRMLNKFDKLINLFDKLINLFRAISRYFIGYIFFISHCGIPFPFVRCIVSRNLLKQCSGRAHELQILDLCFRKEVQMLSDVTIVNRVGPAKKWDGSVLYGYHNDSLIGLVLKGERRARRRLTFYHYFLMYSLKHYTFFFRFVIREADALFCLILTIFPPL